MRQIKISPITSEEKKPSYTKKIHLPLKLQGVPDKFEDVMSEQDSTDRVNLKIAPIPEQKKELECSEAKANETKLADLAGDPLTPNPQKRDRLVSAAPVLSKKPLNVLVANSKIDYDELFNGLKPINIHENDDEISIRSAGANRRLSLGNQLSSAKKILNPDDFSENGSLVNIRGRLTLENGRLEDTESRI